MDAFVTTLYASWHAQVRAFSFAMDISTTKILIYVKFVIFFGLGSNNLMDGVN